MEQSIYNEIESLVKSNIIFRFGLELSNTQDSQRKKDIQNILQRYETKREEENIKEKREKMFEQIDKEVFKQKWTKLSDFHKEIKIKEYVEEKYNSHKNKNLLLNLLIETLKEGKLKTEKFIKYDSKNSKIAEINNLLEEEDSFKFENKKVKSKTEDKNIKDTKDIKDTKNNKDIKESKVEQVKEKKIKVQPKKK